MFYCRVTLAFLILFAIPSCFKKKAQESKPAVEQKIKLDFEPDFNSSPCDDYYAHICDNELKEVTLPPGREFFRLTFENSKRFLRDERRIWFKNALAMKEKEWGVRTRQFFDYYNSCIDREARLIAEKGMLKEIRKAFLGVNKEDAIGALALGDFMGFPSFIRGYPHEDPRDSTKMSYFIEPRKFILNDYKDKKKVESYRKVIKTLFSESGNSKFSRHVDAIIRFEKEMSQFQLNVTEWRKRYYAGDFKTYDVGTFTKSFGKIGINELLGESFVHANAKVVDFHPEALTHLSQLLQKMSEDEIKALAFYYMTSPLVRFALPKFRKAFLTLVGKQEPSNLAEECFKEISSGKGFENELDFEVIQTGSYFPDFPVKRIEDIIKLVKHLYAKEIEKSLWLSQASKREAIKKIRNIKSSLVFPLEEKNWNFLAVEHYSKTDYISNKQKLLKATKERQLNKVGAPVDINDWEVSPLSSSVGARYSPSANQIRIWGGYIYPPIFQPEGKPVLSAALIAVIGHEISHALDDNGILTDTKGNRRDWMKKDDETSYIKRVSIIDSGYLDSCRDILSRINLGRNEKDEQLDVAEICRDFPQRSRGENITDVVGLQLAEKVLIGPHQSQEEKELFFRSYAVQWCSKVSKKKTIEILEQGNYPLPSMRLNEVVKHSRHFSETFGCNKGLKLFLSEKDKLRVW